MPKVQTTTSITVDNAVFAVEKMSPGVKQMVEFMDEWRQKEVDLSVELTMVRSALRDIQNTLYTTINKERQEALAKAKDLGLIGGPGSETPSAANEAGEAVDSQHPDGK